VIEPHVKSAWDEHAPQAHAEHFAQRVVSIHHAHVDKHGHKTPHDSYYRVQCSCGELVQLPFEEQS
jgi:hypothetical protein